MLLYASVERLILSVVIPGGLDWITGISDLTLRLILYEYIYTRQYNQEDDFM